jgi:hypothetical protein
MDKQCLNQYSNLPFVKSIIGTEMWDQLFLFLHDSPVLKENFDLVLDQKINYRSKCNSPLTNLQTAFVATPMRTNKETFPNTSLAIIHNTFQVPIHVVDFGIIHKTV